MRLLMPYETVFPHAFGGLESRNHQLATALSRRGHTVTLAAFYDPVGDEPVDPRGPRLLRLGSKATLWDAAGRRRERSALRFAAAMSRIDLGSYDVIETPSMPYAHLLPLALRCRLARRPLVVTWFEYWGTYWRTYVRGLASPLYAAAERLAAQLGAVVLSPSRLTTDRLAAARRGHDVRTLPCGIDAHAIATAAARGDGGGPPFVFAGRLLAHKRLDVLLRALARLAHLRPGEPVLAVFGDGPERERLQRLAGELGMAGRVRFHGHVAGMDGVWEAFGRARVAVQPSSREGFGLFPLEAMAAGLPVVYCESTESAVGELVRDGRDGVRCVAEPEALARALADADALARPDTAAAIRERARQYDWSVIAPRFEALCEELIARTRHAPARHARARRG